MVITIRARKSGRKIEEFESGNPLAFGAYTRFNHEKLICMCPDGTEYLPYTCSNCKTKYGGYIFNPCPNCGCLD